MQISVYMGSSIAVLPGAPGMPWVDPVDAVAAGRVEEARYPSRVYGGTRRVWSYHPPGDAPPAGLLVCFATELIPWIRAKEKVPADAGRTIIAGYSAAGLGATFVAFQPPGLAGNVLAQSGAFWRGFEGEGASEYEWLAGQYAATPEQQTRFICM
jgi:enterochelin esterase-like enzyme